MQDRILNMMGVATQLKHHIDPSIKVGDLSPGQMAQLVNAWETLEERKRKIRMKPLPKAVDVEKAKKKGPPVATFRE